MLISSIVNRVLLHIAITGGGGVVLRPRAAAAGLHTAPPVRTQAPSHFHPCFQSQQLKVTWVQHRDRQLTDKMQSSELRWRMCEGEIQRMDKMDRVIDWGDPKEKGGRGSERAKIRARG